MNNGISSRTGPKFRSGGGTSSSRPTLNGRPAMISPFTGKDDIFDLQNVDSDSSVDLPANPLREILKGKDSEDTVNDDRIQSAIHSAPTDKSTGIISAAITSSLTSIGIHLPYNLANVGDAFRGVKVKDVDNNYKNVAQSVNGPILDTKIVNNTHLSSIPGLLASAMSANGDVLPSKPANPPKAKRGRPFASIMNHSAQSNTLHVTGTKRGRRPKALAAVSTDLSQNNSAINSKASLASGQTSGKHSSAKNETSYTGYGVSSASGKHLAQGSNVLEIDVDANTPSDDGAADENGEPSAAAFASYHTNVYLPLADTWEDIDSTFRGISVVDLQYLHDMLSAASPGTVAFMQRYRKHFEMLGTLSGNDMESTCAMQVVSDQVVPVPDTIGCSSDEAHMPMVDREVIRAAICPPPVSILTDSKSSFDKYSNAINDLICKAGGRSEHLRTGIIELYKTRGPHHLSSLSARWSVDTLEYPSPWNMGFGAIGSKSSPITPQAETNSTSNSPRLGYTHGSLKLPDESGSSPIKARHVTSPTGEDTSSKSTKLSLNELPRSENELELMLLKYCTDLNALYPGILNNASRLSSSYRTIAGIAKPSILPSSRPFLPPPIEPIRKNNTKKNAKMLASSRHSLRAGATKGLDSDHPSKPGDAPASISVAFRAVPLSERQLERFPPLFTLPGVTDISMRLGKRKRNYLEVWDDEDFVHYTKQQHLFPELPLDDWCALLPTNSESHDGYYREWIYRAQERNYKPNKPYKYMNINTNLRKEHMLAFGDKMKKRDKKSALSLRNSQSAYVAFVPPPVPSAMHHPACWGTHDRNLAVHTKPLTANNNRRSGTTANAQPMVVIADLNKPYESVHPAAFTQQTVLPPGAYIGDNVDDCDAFSLELARCLRALEIQDTLNFMHLQTLVSIADKASKVHSLKERRIALETRLHQCVQQLSSSDRALATYPLRSMFSANATRHNLDITQLDCDGLYTMNLGDRSLHSPTSPTDELMYGGTLDDSFILPDLQEEGDDSTAGLRLDPQSPSPITSRTSTTKRVKRTSTITRKQSNRIASRNLKMQPCAVLGSCVEAHITHGPFINQLRIGDFIDYINRVGIWSIGVVIALRKDGPTLLRHVKVEAQNSFAGDCEWLCVEDERIAPPNTQIGKPIQGHPIQKAFFKASESNNNNNNSQSLEEEENENTDPESSEDSQDTVLL